MSQTQILKLLLQAQGEYLSGERLSEALGITRAAVWKGVEALRRRGYDIESKTRRGYRLCAVPDQPDAQALMEQVQVHTVGRVVRCFETLDSTNNYAKQAAQEGAENGLVVIADQQTGGRGRLGRAFQSPPKRGLYLSALLRPHVLPEQVLPVTALAAVAACNAIERACGAQAQIKWTNDLVLGGKKLAGILTEMGIEGESGALQYVVVGIGINVNHQRSDFSGDVADMATSLRMELGEPVARSALAAALIEELDGLYQVIGGDMSAYLADYRRRCVTLGRQVRILGSGPERTGEAVAVDENFGLVIRGANGALETVRSGEVSVRGLYGYV